MEGYTGIPESIEQYMSYSMLTQAEGLKYGVEHYRRHMERTSESLIWQFNDSWPGTSWSLIDYLLLRKACGDVIIHVQSFSGVTIVQLQIEVSVEPYRCKMIVTIEEQDLL